MGYSPQGHRESDMTERLNNDSSKRCVWSISCLLKSFWDHVHIGGWGRGF